MPVDVLTRIEIRRPPNGVAAFAQDPDWTPDGYETSARWSGRRPAARRGQPPLLCGSLPPTSSGTEVTLRNRVEPNGFSAQVSPWMAMRRAVEADLARLKRLLEGAGD